MTRLKLQNIQPSILAEVAECTATYPHPGHIEQNVWVQLKQLCKYS